ncbi:MAG TPA: Fe2+-dependent dioxygenase [Deltaproteobacteria bacterium]|nr:Fe2+-dependent dioxygenase [Deltaproteobacteria bacterium]
MLLTVSSVVSKELLNDITALATTLSWTDGTSTAGATARAVKHNLQADLSTGSGAVMRTRLLDAIRSHPLVRSAARPHRFSRLLLSRTEPGGGYGAHVDNALMGRGNQQIRTDISFTLFLSDPESYTGGELEVERPGMVHSLKPQAGDLVMYPATNLHRVAPVTKGSRLVCVGWIQSTIPDQQQREVLMDLENVRVALRSQHSVQSAEMLVLQKTIANLTRMWARLG